MLIKKYTQDWIQAFTDIKYELEKALLDTEYQIEHVGSTSLPNLDSKSIVS